MDNQTPAEATAADDSRRAGYIKGLRALADALEDNPAIPLPYQGTDADITIMFLTGDDRRRGMADAARAIPCDWAKTPWGDGGSTAYLDLMGQLHGLRLALTAYRNDVCERVVTGTREVTKTVKDPEALAAVPEVEVTETVENVEWICGSLLAPEGPVAA
jgi:hypothetical protein